MWKYEARYKVGVEERVAVFIGEHDALADAEIEGGRGRKLMDEDEIAKHMQLMTQFDCPRHWTSFSHYWPSEVIRIGTQV